MIDGLFLNRILEEMGPDLTGAKINKIHQPEKTMILFKLKTSSGLSRNLLISAHPQNARIHFTEESFTNPKQPPLFAMVLRKHIEGGRIISVFQEDLDRICGLTIEAYSEIGDLKRFTLMIEIMGKHSNIILCDEENIILAGIKQYSTNVSRYRKVLPGEEYILPPKSGKINPWLITEESLPEIITEQGYDKTFEKAILQSIEGISPKTAKEIVYRSGLSRYLTPETAGLYEYQKIYKELNKILQEPNRPALMLNHNISTEFYFTPYESMETDYDIQDSLSSLCDIYFVTRERQNAFLSRKQSILRVLYQKRDQLKKTVSKQESELETAENGEAFRICGELLSANLYCIQPYQDSVTLQNFYDENKDITIPLNPLLSPNDNAGHYFKKYNKAKHARNKIIGHLKENRENLEYLESLCFQGEEAINDDDLAITNLEMIKAGLIKEKKGKKKTQKAIDSQPIITEYMGYTIMIGRNNKQNDKLTLQTARKNDLWLHTKNIPGSHVIISRKNNKEIPVEVIEEAASYGAYHSKARNSSKVPVDYTEVKQVQKPNGAKPGMVIYFEQTTIYVEPKEI